MQLNLVIVTGWFALISVRRNTGRHTTLFLPPRTRLFRRAALRYTVSFIVLVHSSFKFGLRACYNHAPTRSWERTHYIGPRETGRSLQGNVADVSLVTSSTLKSRPAKRCGRGNATDLSLLTHMTAEDISHLQTVGKDAQKSRSQFILRDDQEKVWDHIQKIEDARVDFILDNAGFEVRLPWSAYSMAEDNKFSSLRTSYSPISSSPIHRMFQKWYSSALLLVLASILYWIPSLSAPSRSRGLCPMWLLQTLPLPSLLSSIPNSSLRSQRESNI